LIKATTNFFQTSSG